MIVAVDVKEPNAGISQNFIKEKQSTMWALGRQGVEGLSWGGLCVAAIGHIGFLARLALEG